MFESFAEFVAQNYPRARKIVEVGVGHRIDVALQIKDKIPNADIIVTDKDEAWIRAHRTRKVKAVADDVQNPRLAVYEGADLVYSVQPPGELAPSIVRLAISIGADLLIMPIMDEQEVFLGGDWEKVTRQGRTLAWLLPRKQKN